jgi:hypothetical protein
LSAAEETVSFCVDQTGLAGCLVIEVGGSFWDSEISWNLADGATGGQAFYLEGGSPFYQEINCPVPGCTDETAANYNPDATEDDGSCVSACTDVAFSCDGGSYQGEVSWSVSDADGNVVASGGAPESGTLCLADGCYTVDMVDSWGDGWNGNILTIGSDEFTIASGSSGSGVFGVNADCNVYGCMDETASNYNADANTDDGTCEYDCEAYEVDMSDYSCYWYVYVNGGYTVEEMIGYGYDCTCVEEPIVGCMDETATNYDPDAQVDGSCEYSTPAVSCDGAPVIGSYTYGNNESTMFSFLGNEGSTLQVSLTGQTESCCDDLNVYDGAGNLIASYAGLYEDQVAVEVFLVWAVYRVLFFFFLAMNHLALYE